MLRNASSINGAPGPAASAPCSAWDAAFTGSQTSLARGGFSAWLIGVRGFHSSPEVGDQSVPHCRFLRDATFGHVAADGNRVDDPQGTHSRRLRQAKTQDIVAADLAHLL